MTQKLQNIENAAQQFYKNHGDINAKLLGEFDEQLLKDIRQYYPNKLTGIRIHLNTPKWGKPRGYWTKERIEAKAKEFVLLGSTLTITDLNKKEPALSNAIANHYPGRLRALRRNLAPPNRDPELPRIDNVGEPLLSNGQSFVLIKDLRRKYNLGHRTILSILGGVDTVTGWDAGRKTRTFYHENDATNRINSYLNKKSFRSITDADEQLRKLLEGGINA